MKLLTHLAAFLRLKLHENQHQGKDGHDQRDDERNHAVIVRIQMYDVMHGPIGTGVRDERMYIIIEKMLAKTNHPGKTAF